MGWPKGKPRKGHVNKDGSAHAHWGTRVKGEPIRVKLIARSTEVREVIISEVPVGRPETWGAKYSQSGRAGTAVTNPCPKCGYAYADGGFCPECRWSRPVKVGPINWVAEVTL